MSGDLGPTRARPYQSLSTTATLWVFWAVAAAAVLVGLLHACASAVAVVSGHDAPPLRATVEAVRADPLHPVGAYPAPVGPGWVVYALLVLVVVGLLVGGFAVAIVVGRRVHDRRSGRATPRDLAPMHLRAAAVTARTVLPAAARTVGDVELVVPAGSLRGTELFAQHEDSFCVIAPPRSGKTTRLAVAWTLDAPGPVVATSTKNDLLFLTAGPRADLGTVHVFDTSSISGWANTVRWDPVRGCEDPDEALERGQAWAAGDPHRDGAKNASWFTARAGEVLAYLLHAAALHPGGSMRDVLRWAADFDDPQPVSILRDRGAPGWADLLVARTQSRAGETTDSLRTTVSGLLAPLSSPRVLAAVCPDEGEGFDVQDFLRRPNTLHMLSGKGTANVAPLITMFTGHVVRAAQELSQTSPTGRLWPPLRLILDEAANVAPLPDLASIMSDSGGRGITAMVFCQSHAQMDEKWGAKGAAAIRAAATARLFLPGIDEPEYMRAVSDATGQIAKPRVSVSSGDGRSSVSTSTEKENVMSVDDIRRMPVGTGLLFYKTLKAAQVSLTPWWDRRDADRIKAGLATVQQQTNRVLT